MLVKVYPKVDLSYSTIYPDSVSPKGYGIVYNLTERISNDFNFMKSNDYHVEMKKISFVKEDVVSFTKFLLEVCEKVVGKENKAFVAMKIYEFLSIHKEFVFEHPSLYKTIVNKLLEFEKESDNLLEGDFKTLINIYKSEFNCDKAILHVLCHTHFDQIICDPKKPNDKAAEVNVADGAYKIEYETNFYTKKIARSAVFHVKNGLVVGDVVVTEKDRATRNTVLKCYYYHGMLYNDFVVRNHMGNIFGCYANSQLEGPYKEIVEEVETVSAFYVKGVRKPTYTLRYANGTLRETSNAMGEVKMYFSTGTLEREYTLVGGKHHGEDRSYRYGTEKVTNIIVYEYGKRLSYRRFNKHLQLKLETIYYPSGSVRSTTNYYPNMKVKKDFSYYENGRLRLCKEYFEDGSLKNMRRCDCNGKCLESFSLVERKDQSGNTVRVSSELEPNVENTVWKICVKKSTNIDARLVKMTVPASARRYQESSYYLVEYAFVEGVYEIKSGDEVVGEFDDSEVVVSGLSDNKLEYKIGDVVYPDKYDPEHGHGIYVFKYPEMAWNYYIC